MYSYTHAPRLLVLVLFLLSLTIPFLLKSADMASLLKPLLPPTFKPVLSTLLRTLQPHPNPRPFSTASSMLSSAEFLSPVQTRRSIYPLSAKSPISDDRIIEIVREAILHVPSSFNSQSTRAILLLKKEHEKLWDVTKECLKPQVPPEQFEQTSKKLDGFRAGYGTVLFYEDPEPIKALQAKFPIYADKFPQWSEHTSGMHQYVVWTALEADGLGCNLQHYNPVIDMRVQTEWKVPTEWSLKAQLVFGTPAGEPGKKQFKPVEERMFVHGK